jgi:hypothetical protein
VPSSAADRRTSPPSRSRRRALFGVAASAVVELLGASAHAADGDGAYGRLDGDLLLSGGAGVALQEGSPAMVLEATALYLAMVGPVLRYAESFGATDARFDRSLAVGLELRPLFLGRLGLDLERGPARLDLMLDSFALTLGSFWHSERGSFAATPGLELGAGLSFPVMPSIDGPALGMTGLLRFRDADLTRRASEGLVEQGSMLLFTLSWQGMLDVGLVDARSSPRER